MARKPQRTSSNSVAAAVKAARYTPPPVPEGYELNEAEKQVWDHMIGVRQGWRDFDLILMVKVVKLEAKINDWWSMLERSGPMVRNKRDTLIENPILRSIDTLQRQQLSIITKMQLMTVADPRTLNKEVEKESMETIKKGNVLQLLAKPD